MCKFGKTHFLCRITCMNPKLPASKLHLTLTDRFIPCEEAKQRAALIDETLDPNRSLPPESPYWQLVCPVNEKNLVLPEIAIYRDCSVCLGIASAAKESTGAKTGEVDR